MCHPGSSQEYLQQLQDLEKVLDQRQMLAGIYYLQFSDFLITILKPEMKYKSKVKQPKSCIYVGNTVFAVGVYSGMF